MAPASTSDGAEWREVTPGLYERPMGENEQFIRFIGDQAHYAGREQWSVTATATFRLQQSGDPRIHNAVHVRALREAWKLLRFQHPSIAARASDSSKLTYTIPEGTALEEWLEESFLVVQDPNIDANDIIAGLKPSPSATLRFLAPRSQIILHSSHWRTEGYGAFYLLDCLFSSLASVLASRPDETASSWGSEVHRLAPSLEWALELPRESSLELDAISKWYLATGAHLIDTAGLAQHGDATVRPQGTRHVQLSVPKATTETLEANCSAKGLSLYSAVHAAVAASNHVKAPPADAQKHHTSTIRLNLRPFLPRPYQNGVAAAGLYTGGYLVRVGADQSVTENAKTYESEYNGGLTDDFLRSRRRYAELALALLRTRVGPPPANSNIDVSFVRDVDEIVHPVHAVKGGTLEVVELGLGVETLTRQPYCFFWVFRGSLHMQLWYNEAYYDETVAQNVLDTVRNLLLSELS